MPETTISYSHLDSASTISTAIKIWEIYLRDQNKSEYTIKAFLGDLGLLMEFLPPDISTGDISLDDLNRFIKWLENGRGRNISCSAKSLSRRITTLKSFFRWLSNNSRIPSDPAKELIQHTVISPLPEVLTPVEEEKVINTALKITKSHTPDPRPYVLLKLLLESGIKKRSALNRKRNNFFFNIEKTNLLVANPNRKDGTKKEKLKYPLIG